MSKKVQHLVLKTTAGSGVNISMTQYLDLPVRKQKRLIDRLHKKAGKGPLVMGNAMSFYWPEAGIEALSMGGREVIVIYGVRTPVENVSKDIYPEIWCDELKSFIKR